MAEPIDRPPLPLPCRGSSTPQSSGPAAAPSPLGRGGRPGPACIGQNGQPKWRPESFFSFLLREVETPLRRGVEIPLRLSLRQGMAPPQLRGDPCEANLIPVKLTSRAFSRPKWRGCGPQANLWGFFPPSTTARGCSPFFANPAP